MKEFETKYMERAIELAKKGLGFTSPNPLVGAVIVKEGRIIGEGYHEKYGGLHAERNALAACTECPKGAAMYVTLEPCSHHGKQPPCTEAIIEAGISTVIVGSADPNPLVSGKGILKLKEAGLEVVENFLRQECDALNPVFFYYITRKLPFVSVKYAMTLDGKIATRSGSSKWITSEEARNYGHALRAARRGIAVGVGTILADDPLLSAHGFGRDPVRIIFDSNLKTPLQSQVVKTAKTYETILVTCVAEQDRQAPYKNAGCQVLTVDKKDNRVDVGQALEVLASLKIDSILVEGGGTLLWSFFSCNLVNEIYAFIAPKILGGLDAKSPVEGFGVNLASEAFTFNVKEFTQVGPDILVHAMQV